MNAERLHVIVLAIKEELEQTLVLETLTQLRDSLQSQVNQPQQAAHQQQVSTLLKKITRQLEEAPSNSFSPSWLQTVIEIGAIGILGKGLLEQIRTIFERNQITPSVAHQEVQELTQKLEQFKNAVNQLSTAFETLGIGKDELDPGQCELAVLVPRSSVQNTLNDLGLELNKLHKIFGTFAELATGSRPDFKVRHISSSDFSVLLDLVPEIAACLAIAVERVVELYKKLLEIRALRTQLSDQGLTDKALKGVDTHANNHMTTGIQQLVEELFEKYGQSIETGRKNELRTDVGMALNQIANRIDRGYNIDIRVFIEQHDEQSEENAEKVEQGETQDAINTILEKTKGLQFLKPAGEPILTLPDHSGEEGEEDATPGKS